MFKFLFILTSIFSIQALTCPQGYVPTSVMKVVKTMEKKMTQEQSAKACQQIEEGSDKFSVHVMRKARLPFVGEVLFKNITAGEIIWTNKMVDEDSFIAVKGVAVDGTDIVLPEFFPLHKNTELTVKCFADVSSSCVSQ